MLHNNQPTRHSSLPAIGFVFACLLLAGALAFITRQTLHNKLKEYGLH